jgi:hypothetical protein
MQVILSMKSSTIDIQNLSQKINTQDIRRKRKLKNARKQINNPIQGTRNNRNESPHQEVTIEASSPQRLPVLMLTYENLKNEENRALYTNNQPNKHERPMTSIGANL